MHLFLLFLNQIRDSTFAQNDGGDIDGSYETDCVAHK